MENQLNQTTAYYDVKVKQRTEFYKKTYLNLALGVAVFVLFETILLGIPAVVNFMLNLVSQKFAWLILLGGFMGVTWYSQSLAYNTASKKKQYLGYFLYIFAEAVIFVPILYIAINMTNSANLLMEAVILTGALFLGLTSVVFGTSVDFSFLRTIIIMGSFLAFGTIVAGMLFGFDLGLWFSLAMIGLASGSIIYSTYNLKNQFSTEQYIPAALSLFASLMLLFWYILRILMSRK